MAAAAPAAAAAAAAAAGPVRSKAQFLCSICEEVFTDPVSTPCGHNFCNSCICEHWRVNVPCQCPTCKEDFDTKPKLKINTFISEMVGQFRREEQKKTEAEIEQMILERRVKILEIQCSVEVGKNVADREAAEGVQVFTALMESVQKGLNQLIEDIQDKQRTNEKQAAGFIKELEQEICELEKRSTGSGREDHLQFVQKITSAKTAPSTKTKVGVGPPSYEGTVVRALSELEKKLTEEKKKAVEAELRRVQQYEVDLVLDPDTAHPKLVLSDDGKQVHHGDGWKNLPDKPQRFSSPCILVKQSFSSGRFYYQVQVKGKTDWTLGVVRESITRKGKINVSPLDGFWTIGLKNVNQYYAWADSSVRLSVKSGLQKVGVYVDYEEGLVSFYDVDSSVLIYSFIGCCFKNKLLPFFCPRFNDSGTNSAPLIITPVKH